MGWKTVLVIGIVAYFVYQRYFDSFDPAIVKDKRVVITGASTGIGEHIAYHYARFGARILITARRGEVLKKVAEKCKELGAREAFYIPLDMGKEEDSKTLIDEAEKRLGGLDHLILNHIIGTEPKFWGGEFDSVLKRAFNEAGSAAGFIHTEWKAASKILALAVDSVVLYGRTISVLINNIAKSTGKARKFAVPFLAAYSASKFALHGFFYSLRQEYEMRNFGVSITTFVLGGINTTNAINRLSQVLKPEVLSATPSDAALRIVQGTAKREREVTFPGGPSILLLRDIAPVIIERLIPFGFNSDTVKDLVDAQEH